jgi:PIN domain nuclease of toxin-antitoxin system
VSLYVTDTHPLIWYATNHHRQLSSKALRAFKAADSGRALILIPSVALWEVSILIRMRRIRLVEPFSQWADMLLAKPGFDLASLDSIIISEAMKFSINDDIFDAAIVATATTRELPLITRDQGILESGTVEVMW